MLSLAYRIATLKPVFHEDDIIDADFVKYSQSFIRRAVHIRADNVSEFTESQPEKLNISKDVPNWIPPFDRCFVDFSFSVNDEHGRLQSAQAGALVTRHDARDNAPNGTAFTIIGLLWGAMLGEKASGRPLYQGFFMLDTDKSGKCLDAGINCFRPSIQDLNFKIMIVAGFCFSFMHCKNVRQIDAKDESASLRFRQQYKVPKFTYRTLCIDPMKEVLRSEGGLEMTGLKRALHICRGHFSTYSEEKPLFGRYPGTFWVPDHVRGKKEYGEVQKDYDVKPMSDISQISHN